MKVITIEDGFANVKSGGLTRLVNIQMVPDIKIGDYVIVHAGFAIEIVNKEAAKRTLELIREIKE